MNTVSPHLFVALVERTADAVFVLRVQNGGQAFIMEYVNNAYLRKFDQPREKFIGKELKDFLSPEKCAVVRERLTACVKNKTILRYEENIILNNKTFTSLSEAFPIDNKKGAVEYVVGISKDITELKQQRDQLSESENTLQGIMNSSDNITLLIGSDLRIVYANAAAQRHAIRMLGKEYIIGDLILSYLSEAQVNTAAEHFLALVKQDKKSFTFEHSIAYPDGEESWFIRRYYPVTDNNSKIIGVVVNSVNITERKRQEMQIQKHADALREIAKMQSHEMRRPVANIIGLTDLIDLQKPVAENAEVIAHLKKSTQELDELIRRIIAKTNNENL